MVNNNNNTITDDVLEDHQQPDIEKHGINNLQPAEVLEHIEELTKRDDEPQVENIFPVDVFPKAIQEIIQATHGSLDYPIDFIGASLLYAASVAIGNTHRLEIRKGHQESAVLYLAIVGRAGTNKSHPLGFALRPLQEADKKTYKTYEHLQYEYERASGMSRKERIQEGIEDPIKPNWQKHLVSDFTPEALHLVHKANPRGVGVNVDELAGWFKNFNRYNKGSEMEFWLSAWSGTPINIDRKTSEPIYIPLPFISVAGTIQTGILNQLARENRTQNGFMDRILFVIPDNLEKPRWSNRELDPKVFQAWDRIVSSILNIPLHPGEDGYPRPQVLHFSPEAHTHLLEWHANLADECNNAESEVTASALSKMDVYACRLALILEILFWACDNGDKQVVRLDTLRGALKLTEYFKRSALKVCSIVSTDLGPVDKLSAIKQKLYQELPNTFTTSEGLIIAEGLQIPERTYKRFLNEKDLFKCISRGNYKKRI